ncbi:tetratricopeptide repeat protein [Novipirellula artificiosorum]|nr:tetratricopeptide repeat protein [Novipirellula artificiosorum]
MTAKPFVAVLLFAAFGVLLDVAGCSRPAEVPIASAPSSPEKTKSPEKPKSISAQRWDPEPAIAQQPTAEVYATSLPSSAAGYIGTDACAECHAEQYESYQATHHSRSLRLASDAADEVTGAYYHQPSKASYHAVRDGTELKHQEWIHFPTEKDASANLPLGPEAKFLAAELPVKYVMGSGAFAKGYLLSDNGMLLQSPMTWYVAAKSFAMAPRYDVPHHLGMKRMISDGCLYCHAGLAYRENGNEHKLVVTEVAIGCERCHGPGQDHLDWVESDTASDAEDDYRIVQPANLNRQRAEEICAQCHLQGSLFVYAEGKTIWDYRPGERLDATQVSYKVDSSSTKDANFTDHFEQLWQSPCYQQSETLTCITCHDPHHSPTGESAREIHQQNCLSCHDDSACGLDHETRMQRAQNQCVQCHMPKGESAIPHTATTQHRIGIHVDNAAPTAKPSEPKLRRLHNPLDPEAQSTTRRNDALATASWLREGVYEGIPSPELRQKTIDELLKLADSDQRDAAVHEAIARLAKQDAILAKNAGDARQMWNLAEKHAATVLRMQADPTLLRQSSLSVLFDKSYSEGNFSKAVRYGIELAENGRSAVDWYNLGLVFGRLQRFGEAESAFRRSIEIDAGYLSPYRSLFKLYSSTDPALAEQVGRTGMMLETRQQAR